QSSNDQPINYSINNKKNDFNSQHISHVFGNDKQEKKFKKDQDYIFEQQINGNNNNNNDDDDDDDDDEDVDDHHHLLSFRKKQIKYEDDHRPLTPISSSSSPQTI